MTREEVVGAVRRVLEEEFEVEPQKIHADAHLFQDLGLDSLDAVDMLVSLENAVGRRVSEVEAKKIRTVADVHRLLEAHVGGPAAGPVA